MLWKQSKQNAVNSVTTLLVWLSPAFPVGGYAYSHGLEQAVEDGDVTDPASLEAWLEEALSLGLGRNDAMLLAEAVRSLPPEPWDETTSASSGTSSGAGETGAAASRAMRHQSAASARVARLPRTVSQNAAPPPTPSCSRRAATVRKSRPCRVLAESAASSSGSIRAGARDGRAEATRAASSSRSATGRTASELPISDA
ncbi:urease accessory protein UreF [Hansschlegelia beijingensis]|uniref:urease accessory protein UreF n=1 Tax=Hansschlegelia beijingensis TaxID=1133344 RepID=UPI00387F033C